MRLSISAALLLLLAPIVVGAQKLPAPAAPLKIDPMAAVPKLAPIVARSESDLAPVVERYSADLRSVSRRYDATDSPDQRKRLRDFNSAWRSRLHDVDFDKLNAEGRADYVLLDNHLNFQIALLDREDRKRGETVSLLPFTDRLLALQDTRRNLISMDPTAAARSLAVIMRQVDSMRTLFDPAPPARGDSAKPRAAAPKVSRTVANRAADNLDQARAIVTNWYRYYDGYDPMFSWWVKSPYAKLDSSLMRYARTLRERVVGIPPAVLTAAAARGGGGAINDGPIVGDPIGDAGLAEDLRHEMIPYTPSELIAIAEREYAFSLSEMKKAARDLGFGDDWKAAMEKVKNTYVEPGKQPDLIRDLARQAENYFDAHDWVTIPPLAREDWRMEMLSPERQKVSPFFLGGESILVSYPTADMTDEDKLMSLRGNNPHFSHATVFHELNPGHHLQDFMQARYNQHRRLFGTPFWNEGQSLYWEMFVWDKGFHSSAEDRVGALFWRMHRSARIIFSLNFHQGKMTPDQAIQFLVDTVGFERANAEGEVRRSFNGSYSPLYQAGYMLGGLQLRALHHELVDGGKMTERAFHDAILEGGAMPIAMVRARLMKLSFGRDGGNVAAWRFAEQLPPPLPWSGGR
ncbi:MAG: hypothetical protein JWL61_238 [Gemmatimonadetes bacterium]|nr:hypothetical protein [Gemmatimonadota bacterium]